MRQTACHQLCWIIGGTLAMCLALPVYAAVYIFSSEDGTVHLSNVPVDNKFVLFWKSRASVRMPYLSMYL